MIEVAFVLGYPASGKSTIAHKLRVNGYAYLNRDQVGGKVVDLVPLMIEEIERGNNVVLDNTFPTRESRKPFIFSEYPRKRKIPMKFETVKDLCRQIVAKTKVKQKQTKDGSIEFENLVDDDLMNAIASIAQENTPVEPLSPADMKKAKDESIPYFVVQAFNLCVTSNWNGATAVFSQDEVIAEIVRLGQATIPQLSREIIFAKHWLDVEPIFMNKGWHVSYDKPDLGESGVARFEFRPKAGSWATHSQSTKR